MKSENVTMKKRQLGKTDIKISEVGLGTWQLSGDVWGKKTEAEYIQAIEIALDADINYLDTALDYTPYSLIYKYSNGHDIISLFSD